jgi:hypothetical protein
MSDAPGRNPEQPLPIPSKAEAKSAVPKLTRRGLLGMVLAVGASLGLKATEANAAPMDVNGPGGGGPPIDGQLQPPVDTANSSPEPTKQNPTLDAKVPDTTGDNR